MMLKRKIKSFISTNIYQNNLIKSSDILRPTVKNMKTHLPSTKSFKFHTKTVFAASSFSPHKNPQLQLIFRLFTSKKKEKYPFTIKSLTVQSISRIT